MLVYNVTLKIEPGCETEWLRWQKEEHIPKVMATGMFTGYKFFKLLEQDEQDGPTYIVQYFAATRADYDAYINDHAPAMRRHMADAWEGRFVAFRTIMEVVN